MGRDGKPVTAAQKRATAKYEAANYDKIMIRLKKGVKDEILAAIEEGGSLNGFITSAIMEKLGKQ